MGWRDRAAEVFDRKYQRFVKPFFRDSGPLTPRPTSNGNTTMREHANSEFPDFRLRNPRIRRSRTDSASKRSFVWQQRSAFVNLINAIFNCVQSHESPHFMSDSILPRVLATCFFNESILRMAKQCGRRLSGLNSSRTISIPSSHRTCTPSASALWPAGCSA